MLDYQRKELVHGHFSLGCACDLYLWAEASVLPFACGKVLEHLDAYLCDLLVKDY